MRSSNCRQYEPGPDNSVQLGVAYSGMQLVLLTTPHPPMPLSHCIVETTSPHADCCAVASKQPPKVTTMIRATCAPRMAGARESRAGAKLRSAAPLPPPMAGGQGGWCQAVARLLLRWPSGGRAAANPTVVKRRTDPAVQRPHRTVAVGSLSEVKVRLVLVLVPRILRRPHSLDLSLSQYSQWIIQCGWDGS